jgi:aerobic carbon-monoxide dehydrogenase large subunit
VRVVAGNIGGSFGMKSAIYPEVALVLLASKLLGRPVGWTSTRSEAFLGDTHARDNVTQAELALERDGHFLGLSVKTIAAVGAYPQAGSNAFVNNLGTLAGSIARRRCMPTSPPSTPTPTRCGPIAAMDGPRRLM